MALNQFFLGFQKNLRRIDILKDLEITKKITYLISFFTIFLILVIFFIVSNTIKEKQKLESQNFETVVKSKDFLGFKDYFVSKINSPYEETNYLIKNNDSIEKIMKKYKIDNNDIKIISNGLKEKKLTNIFPGKQLKLITKMQEDGTKKIVNLVFPTSNTRSIEIRKNKENFIIKENILKLYKKEVVIKNKISNNLYSAAVDAGIEPNIIIEFARIYGFEVDFQRDIRKGDWFEIFYERFEDDNDIVKDTGKIIYASMFVNGNEINLYNFNDGNDFGYYDIKGKSIVKSLMKTPINGARLSSSFGMRKHPILGYNKMHRGTDFAAPSGTPIMASGSGTVTRARWCGGGGNCVKIKHNSTYQTVYAHMKNFAKGIKEGKKVRQGQIIGYVGSTGLSTGPHLHYEVIVNGKKVNSQRLKLPSGKILKGDVRKEFELERIKIDLKLSELR